jgi:hypothetical protein
MATGILHRPMAWPGTEEQKMSNRATHLYFGDDDWRCTNCDCRPGGTVADWPCGTEPPRETVAWGAPD